MIHKIQSCCGACTNVTIYRETSRGAYGSSALKEQLYDCRTRFEVSCCLRQAGQGASAVSCVSAADDRSAHHSKLLLSTILLWQQDLDGRLGSDDDHAARGPRGLLRRIISFNDSQTFFVVAWRIDRGAPLGHHRRHMCIGYCHPRWQSRRCCPNRGRGGSSCTLCVGLPLEQIHIDLLLL